MYLQSASEVAVSTMGSDLYLYLYPSVRSIIETLQADAAELQQLY